MQLVLVALLLTASLPQDSTTVLRAETVLDGRGGTQHNVDIVIVAGRIARIGPRGGGPVPAARASSIWATVPSSPG